MDTLHTVMRSINGEQKSNATTSQREHMTVFREFLRHLERAQKRNAAASRKNTASTKSSNSRKR